MSKHLKFAGTLLAVALILLVVVVVKLLPAKIPTKGFATVVHTGYTNSANGEPLAVFTVANRDQVRCTLMERYWLQTPLPGRGDGKTFFQGDLAGGRRTILPGSAQTLFVPAPDTNVEWRIYLFVEQDEGTLAYRLRETLSDKADQLGWRGLPAEFQNRMLGLPGQWIGAVTNGVK